jgi:benzodiazapine receptor
VTAAGTSRRWVALGLFLAASFAAAGIGVAFQGSDVQEFYRQELVLPGWAPPAWLFGPVWTVLYVAIAVAAWRVWEAAGWTTGLTVWVLQLAVNAAWTPAFFNLRTITLALAVILVLLGMIVIMAIRFADHDTVAVALVVPYLAWVTFATALTIAVWSLNPGLR